MVVIDKIQSECFTFTTFRVTGDELVNMRAIATIKASEDNDDEYVVTTETTR